MDDLLLQDETAEGSLQLQKLNVEEIVFPAVHLCINANGADHRKIG